MIKATPDDLNEAYSVIVECHEWLHSRGIKQWDSLYPKERYQCDIENGLVYLFEKNKQIIGTVTLNEQRPEYYPESIWKDKLYALYICRLAIRRNHKNQSIGSIILSEVEEEARVDGVQVLRLDVVKSNPFLEQYYSKHGFQTVGDYEFYGQVAWLMEKELTYPQ